MPAILRPPRGYSRRRGRLGASCTLDRAAPANACSDGEPLASQVIWGRRSRTRDPRLLDDTC